VRERDGWLADVFDHADVGLLKAEGFDDNRRWSGCTSNRVKAALVDAAMSCGANRSRFFQAEDRSNSRMIQRSEQLRLVFESRHTLRVRGKRGWQHLDRDVSAEAGIGSAIDFAHPASQRAEREKSPEESARFQSDGFAAANRCLSASPVLHRLLSNYASQREQDVK